MIITQFTSANFNPYLIKAKIPPTKISSHRYISIDLIGKNVLIFVFNTLDVLIHKAIIYTIEITKVATAGPNIAISDMQNTLYKPKLKKIFTINNDNEVFIKNFEFPLAAITK